MDIDSLLWLQGVRESAPLFVQGFFSFLGSETAIAMAMVLPCIIYWCVDKESGQFALLAYSASSVFNQLLKNTVCEYRPWIRDARVSPDPLAIGGAEGYSFPSGHTQSCASLMGGLVWHERKGHPWLAAFSLIFTILIGFSRLFLGVHAPQDVLVALVEGYAFVLLSARLVPWILEGNNRDLKALAAGCILTLIFLVYATVKSYPIDYVDGSLVTDPAEMVVSCYKVGGVYVGVLTGWVVERHYVQFETEGITFTEGALRLVVGSIVAYGVYELCGHQLMVIVGENPGQFFRHLVLFFMITAGAPVLFEPLGRLYVQFSRH